MNRATIRSWKDVIGSIIDTIGKENYGILAAGAAYYATLAFFPLMATIVAITSLLVSPETIAHTVTTAAALMPEELSNLISAQLSKQSAFGGGNIVVAIIGLVVAFIGASGAIENLTKGLNVAFRVKEDRSFVKLKLTSILLTTGGILAGLLIVALLSINSGIFTFFGVPDTVANWLIAIRWPTIVAIVVLGLSVLYNVAPNRKLRKWRWEMVGTIVATLIWLLATILFFVYVQYFARFGQSYGVFASLIMLMMWLNLSAFIVLLGAEINNRK